LVEEGDRRHNVANYQPNKISIAAADIVAIEAELPSFLYALQQHPIDDLAVRTAAKTQAREDLIDLCRPAIDVALRAIKDGNLGWLRGQLPSDESLLPLSQRVKMDTYKSVLDQWEKDAVNGVKCLTRDQMIAALQYVVGDVPESPNKFTSLLKHHRTITEKIWYDNKAQMGIKVKWVP
jgi:hypothetical protein